MPLAQSDWTLQILYEVGAGLDDPPTVDYVTSQMPSIWLQWGWKNYYPGLQPLYVKRSAIDILLGQLRLKINKTIGPLSKQLAGQVANLQAMRKLNDSDIRDREEEAGKTQTPVMGMITAQAPIAPAVRPEVQVPSARDPNDPCYKGSPFSGPFSPGLGGM